MACRELATGKWRVEVDRKGMPRIRRTFPTRAAALTFEAHYLHDQQQHTQNVDPRRLKELIELWYEYHGATLSEGEARKRSLLTMAIALKNPIAQTLKPEAVLALRTQRLKDIKPKTWNNNLGLLKSVYNRLRKLNVINYENPIVGVDALRLHDDQLAFLSLQEIERLMTEIQERGKNPHTYWVTQLCLRTGARWSEAEKLTRRQLYDNKVTYVRTKSRRSRTVPIDPVFFQQLLGHIGLRGNNQRCFSNCAKAFQHAVKRAGIELPPGQMTHVCRHSFASHFIMRGGNILTLQKILGHTDIKMTMRYAHLAPEYLLDAVKYAPV